MSADVLEPIGVSDKHMQQMLALARIKAAKWVICTGGAWALIAQDDNEAMVVLTPRFTGDDAANTLWVVDATDRCYRGLESAIAASVRDLKVSMGLPAEGGV